MENRTRKALSCNPSLYVETLNHLVWMAKQPAAKSHAWHRAKELDSDISGLWVGIKDDLVKNMKEINDLHRD
jgi:hypothetical protein